MTNEEFELKQENQRLLTHVEELGKEKDELRDELNYHKTDSYKFAMVVKEREQEIADLEKGRGALWKRVVELEIALRIKTEEHDCCAEDNISLRKQLGMLQQLRGALEEIATHSVCCDARHIAAPALALPHDTSALDALVKDAMQKGYLLGFMNSGEGWNGEYPFQDHNLDPLLDDKWLKTRDAELEGQ